MTSAINNHKYSESYWFKLEIILVLIRNNIGVNEKNNIGKNNIF